MDTIVTIMTFKDTGKYYDKFQFTTKVPIWDNQGLITAAQGHSEQCKTMDFIMEARQGDACNMRLVKI